MSTAHDKSSADGAADGKAVGKPARTSSSLSFDDAELRVLEIIRRAESVRSGDDEIDGRLGDLMNVVDDLRVPADRAVLLAKAEFALAQLERQPPALVLFDKVQAQLSERQCQARFRRLQRLALAAAPHVVVAAGALIGMTIGALITYFVLPLLDRPDLVTTQLVSEAGFAGALCSLMLRFHRIRGRTVLRSRDAFFEGLFRPFIGVFFAWMAYHFLDAGLIPLQPRSGVDPRHLYMAVAFAAGFSERLAADLAENLSGMTHSGK